MNKSKLKKYVGKNVTVYFRHKLRPQSGELVYRPNEPLNDYFLYQSQCSGGAVICYVALSPKMIGHIEIRK
ncbi:MAG: hypothetical protein K6B67_05755 [Lachnospiraceae bacterium]|nr:hypothetical protein [Lachnospiraceae bacterium]